MTGDADWAGTLGQNPAVDAAQAVPAHLIPGVPEFVPMLLIASVLILILVWIMSFDA